MSQKNHTIIRAKVLQMKQEWKIEFLKLGHFVASKKTRNGESSIISSDSERILAPTKEVAMGWV